MYSGAQRGQDEGWKNNYPSRSLAKVKHKRKKGTEIERKSSPRDMNEEFNTHKQQNLNTGEKAGVSGVYPWWRLSISVIMGRHGDNSLVIYSTFLWQLSV